MKKICVCLLIMLSVAFSSFAVSWYYVGKSSGYGVYIDNANVIKDNEGAILMVRQTHEALILKPIVPGSVADAIYNATW